MNNLTQKQRDAKKAYLDNLTAQMLARYKKAATSERNAIIRHIDSFLLVISKAEKIFWEKFKVKLERMNENQES